MESLNESLTDQSKIYNVYILGIDYTENVSVDFTNNLFLRIITVENSKTVSIRKNPKYSQEIVREKSQTRYFI